MIFGGVFLQEVLVIAHRGASAYAPENTLKSFKTAWEMKADMIELDVQATSDGQLVCIHDYSLERTCGYPHLVYETSYELIRSLDAGEGEIVPLLSDVLAFCRNKLQVNIELKVTEIEEKLISLVKKQKMSAHVIYSSFLHSTLQAIRELDPHARIGVLFTELPKNPIDYVLDLNANTIHPHFQSVTSELVKLAHDNGLKVYPWTVNDSTKMLNLLKCGVDGIITDKPDLAAEVIEAFSKTWKV